MKRNLSESPLSLPTSDIFDSSSEEGDPEPTHRQSDPTPLGAKRLPLPIHYQPLSPLLDVPPESVNRNQPGTCYNAENLSIFGGDAPMATMLPSQKQQGAKIHQTVSSVLALEKRGDERVVASKRKRSATSGRNELAQRSAADELSPIFPAHAQLGQIANVHFKPLSTGVLDPDTSCSQHCGPFLSGTSFMWDHGRRGHQGGLPRVKGKIPRASPATPAKTARAVMPPQAKLGKHEGEKLPPPRQQQEQTSAAASVETRTTYGRPDQWMIRYEELSRYKEQNGDCNVTLRQDSNGVLAQWVKRQRYQYKLKQKGERSHLTHERERLLNRLAFVWDSRDAVWEENYALLFEFWKENNHCRVPKRMSQLSAWAKRQRKQYKLWKADKKSSLTHDRVHRLDELGFQWFPAASSSR